MNARRRTQRPLRSTARVAAVVALVVAGAAVLACSFLAVMLVTGETIDGVAAAGAIVLSTAVGAITWPWASRSVRAWIERVVRGASRTPEDVMRAFQQGTAREIELDDLLTQLAEALLRTMQATTAEMWQHHGTGVMGRSVSVPHRDPATLTLDAAAMRVLAGGGVVGPGWLTMWWPELLLSLPVAELRVAPVTHAGELLGVVVVTRSADAEHFGPEDDAELAELGIRLGLVLHNRRLDAALQDTLADLRRTNDELRASRVRLVATADAERRRLERNLHDGAQQHLVALAVDLRLAADEIAADPTSAPDLFAALGAGVREAIAELRSLAHGIYPPLLMDEGLVEALRVSARRNASPVTVTAASVGRYAPEVEAAAYFCSMEALQNAAKHAEGAAVQVNVTGHEGVLELTIEDDGPGFDPDAVRPGHGLGNMVDRIGAVGGTLVVERSAAGGARIVASIPVDGR